MPSWLPFALATLGCWGLWGFLQKPAAASIGPWSTIVFQGAANFLVSVAVVIFMRFQVDLHPVGVPAALAAGFLGSAGTLGFLYAVGRGETSTILPFTAMYPVLTILLSVIFLRETVSITQGIGILCAIAAIYFLSR